MDNLSFLVLIIIILLVFYIFFIDTKSKQNIKEKIKEYNKEYLQKNNNQKVKKESTDKYLDKIIGVPVKNNNRTNKKEKEINVTTKNYLIDETNVLPYFIEMQFHNDYKDVITAFDKMTEFGGRPVFNRSSQPVDYISMNKMDGYKLLFPFVSELNSVLINKIKDVVDLENGWNNIQENPTVENGWEKQQKKLGLPGSIYDKGAGKSKVQIITVDKVDRFETDTQIKYDVYAIIQKDNSLDQMVIRISLLMDRRDLNEDRNFFKDDKTVDLNIHLESIFIVGFMTSHSYGSQNKNTRQDFYTFENIEKNGMMDQEEIIKQLKKKYLDYQIEANGLTTQISPQDGNNLAIERLTTKTPIYPQ